MPLISVSLGIAVRRTSKCFLLKPLAFDLWPLARRSRSSFPFPSRAFGVLAAFAKRERENREFGDASRLSPARFSSVPGRLTTCARPFPRRKSGLLSGAFLQAPKFPFGECSTLFSQPAQRHPSSNARMMGVFFDAMGMIGIFNRWEFGSTKYQVLSTKKSNKAVCMRVRQNPKRVSLPIKGEVARSAGRGGLHARRPYRCKSPPSQSA